jgi:hypothetical protein
MCYDGRVTTEPESRTSIGRAEAQSVRSHLDGDPEMWIVPESWREARAEADRVLELLRSSGWSADFDYDEAFDEVADPLVLIVATRGELGDGPKIEIAIHQSRT